MRAMAPVLVLLVVAGICSEAQEVAAEFDCLNEESNDDLSLIQKKMEVATTDHQVLAVKSDAPYLHNLLTAAKARKKEEMLSLESHTEKTATATKKGEPEGENEGSEGEEGGKEKEEGNNEENKEGGEEKEASEGEGPKASESATESSDWAFQGPNEDASDPGVKSETKDEKFVWPWSRRHWSKHRQNDNLVAAWDMCIVGSVISWLIWMALALCIWTFFFPKEPEIFRNPEDPVWTFKHNHFACFKRPKLCCCSLCCPGVQWADTMHLAGFMKVDIGLAIFFACALLNGLTFGGFVMEGIFTSTLIVIYRQRLREKLGLKSWTCANCLFDILYVFFCTCCAISQEAQIVRYAYAQGGTKAKTEEPDMVGEPIGRAPYTAGNPYTVSYNRGPVTMSSFQSQIPMGPPVSGILYNSPPVGTQQVITTGPVMAAGPGTLPVGSATLPASYPYLGAPPVGTVYTQQQRGVSPGTERGRPPTRGY